MIAPLSFILACRDVGTSDERDNDSGSPMSNLSKSSDIPNRMLLKGTDIHMRKDSDI